MKGIRAGLLILCFSVLVSFLIYNDSAKAFNGSSRQWDRKERELKTRLFSIPILLYHNIDGRGVFSVKSETLRSHFKLFKERGVRVIALGDLIERLENPLPFKQRVIVITFDDGFNSMYTKLLPLAEEFGYKITLFVYTDFIYKKARKSLTWEKLQSMTKWIDIQCHSISHPDLSEISMANDIESKSRLYRELYLSKRIIELYLDREIIFFAFPYGRYNLRTVELARDSGYRRVFSTDYGSNVLTRDNFCLKRHHIKNTYSLDYIDSLIK